MRIIALLLILSTGVASAGTLDDARQAGVLRVGTPGDYAPFSLRQPDGSYRGADVTEVQRLADHLGLKVVFVPTAWGKLADDAKAHRFDVAVGGISITPARKEFAAFSTVLVSDGKRPLVRCTDRARFNSLSAIDQPAVRVVTNPGGSNEAFDHANLPHATLTVFPDNKTIFGELLAGREDVMVTDGVEVDHQALLHPELCAAAVPAPFTHFENAFLLQPDPALEQAVDGFLDEEVKSGAWQKTLTAAEREP
jgi:cyclohexadienyl dehydratase